MNETDKHGMREGGMSLDDIVKVLQASSRGKKPAETTQDTETPAAARAT
jgi:hypothetical protein